MHSILRRSKPWFASAQNGEHSEACPRRYTMLKNVAGSVHPRTSSQNSGEGGSTSPYWQCSENGRVSSAILGTLCTIVRSAVLSIRSKSFQAVLFDYFLIDKMVRCGSPHTRPSCLRCGQLLHPRGDHGFLRQLWTPLGWQAVCVRGAKTNPLAWP